MEAAPPAGLSPHRIPVDPAALAGHVVLGEPLVLLVSAIFRLQFGAARGGTTEVFATWTREEGEAMKRAMTRIDTPLRSDTRTVGQRESDRFVAVARHVLDYVDELTQARKPAV